MIQKNQTREYILPLKINAIVRREEPELRERISGNHYSCPLYGYVVEQSTEHIPIELEGRCSIEHPHLMSNDRPIELHVQGCAGLYDPICYLKENLTDIKQRRYRRNGPRIVVEQKETCPVYVRVMELLKD